MLNLISSVLQQECKQESENLDKGRITGSAPPPRNKFPLPLNGGRSHAFSFLDLGRSVSRLWPWAYFLNGPNAAASIAPTFIRQWSFNILFRHTVVGGGGVRPCPRQRRSPARVGVLTQLRCLASGADLDSRYLVKGNF